MTTKPAGAPRGACQAEAAVALGAKDPCTSTHVAGGLHHQCACLCMALRSEASAHGGTRIETNRCLFVGVDGGRDGVGREGDAQLGELRAPARNRTRKESGPARILGVAPRWIISAAPGPSAATHAGQSDFEQQPGPSCCQTRTRAPHRTWLHDPSLKPAAVFSVELAVWLSLRLTSACMAGTLLPKLDLSVEL